MNVGKALAAGAVLLTVYVAGVFTGGEADVEVSDLPLAPVNSPCPSNWKDVSDKDEHGRVSACFFGADIEKPQPGDWIVSLDEDDFCSYGIQVDTPNSRRTECKDIPNWPQ